MASGYYAWSDIYAGGDSERREASGNRLIRVVTKRNIIRRGDKVTKAALNVSDEEFDALVESGSIRNYPVPDGADQYTSPSAAFLTSVLDEEGDVDVNKLLDLGLQNPPARPTEVESDTPKGA